MKKQTIAILIAAGLLGVLVVFFGINRGETKVNFDPVPEKAVPRQIEAEILPEYRGLERALACRMGKSIYVIVTRGEKPTAGYGLSVEKISLQSEEGKSCLCVYADFADPDHPENMAQVKTYPYAVVKADLKGLPDRIELKAKYVDKKS